MNYRSVAYILIASICTQYIQAAGSYQYTQLKPWFHAAQTGDCDTIKQLIGSIHINARDPDGDSALMLACANEHEDLVKLLLKIPGIDINAQNNNGSTALLVACHQQSMHIVELLLKNPGINVNVQNLDGMSALLWATVKEHEIIVEHLLSIPEIDINIKNNGGWSPLMCAVSNKHQSLVKLFLKEQEININMQDTKGHTALMLASRDGHETIVKMLLETAGIDINLKNKSGDTALMLAAQQKHENIVKLLLNASQINIEVQNKAGETALTRTTKSIRELIKTKIQELTIRAFDTISKYAKATDLAEQSSNLLLLKSIISQIGEHMVDSTGNMLLHKACIYNASEIISFLISNSKKPHDIFAARNNKGQMPIELISPTSELFKLCMDLAYGQLTSQVNTIKTECAQCTKPDCTEICSVCRTIYYCSQECQKKDWVKHKHICIAQL